MVKRRLTNTLKKLESTIKQYGRKDMIPGHVNNLKDSLNEAKYLNVKFVSVIPENEHQNCAKEYMKLTYVLVF